MKSRSSLFIFARRGGSILRDCACETRTCFGGIAHGLTPPNKSLKLTPPSAQNVTMLWAIIANGATGRRRRAQLSSHPLYGCPGGNMSKIVCPTCNQDMRATPHEGLRGRDCPQCGQGIMWRFARKVSGTLYNKRMKLTLRQAGSRSK